MALAWGSAWLRSGSLHLAAWDDRCTGMWRGWGRGMPLSVSFRSRAWRAWPRGGDTQTGDAVVVARDDRRNHFLIHFKPVHTDRPAARTVPSARDRDSPAIDHATEPKPGFRKDCKKRQSSLIAAIFLPLLTECFVIETNPLLFIRKQFCRISCRPPGWRSVGNTGDSS